MTRDDSRRWRLLAAVALLLATLSFAKICRLPIDEATLAGDTAAASALVPDWLLPIDDAYIFIRYAQQAARGRPFEWNSGEPSTGSSSFLYQWFLMPVHWLSDEVAAWSEWSYLIGVLTLWGLGWITFRVFRGWGYPRGLSLVSGMAVVWSGPVGLLAVSGMESALFGGLVLLLGALWSRRAADRPPPRSALVLLALLPLVRPEGGFLTLLGFAAEARRIRSWRRLAASSWILVPGAFYAATNLLLTGHASPTGAVVKSWLGVPDLPLSVLLRQYAFTLVNDLLPAYVGRGAFLLWPPVGLLAVAGAIGVLWLSRRDRSRSEPHRLVRLEPLVWAWLVLVALAPLSANLTWQAMRHHHGAFVCAWVVALAVSWEVVTWLGSRVGRPRLVGGVVSTALLGALLLTLPAAAAIHQKWRRDLWTLHADVGTWLETNARESVLLVNDAGWLSLRHDGPIVDLFGLGSPDLAEAYRGGPGLSLEALARHRPRPEVAAVTLRFMPAPELLGPPLLPLADPARQTLLARLDRDRLAATELSGPGLDFAYLPHERRYRPRWSLPPVTGRGNRALSRTGSDGQRQVHGCRLLFGALWLDLGATEGEANGSAGSWWLRATALEGDARVVVAAGPAGDREVELGDDRWTEVEVVAGAQGGEVEVEIVRDERSGYPCLESIAREAG